jgi:hypothetical protein
VDVVSFMRMEDLEEFVPSAVARRIVASAIVKE